MYEVKKNSTQIGNNKLFTYEREVIGHKNILNVEAGTRDYGKGRTETYASIISYEGDMMFGPAVDKNTGETRGFAIKTESPDGRDTLIKGLRFLLKVLDEERMGVNN